MISVKHLNKSFGKNHVLHDINIELNPGILGLLGGNGAGKTTFMRCLLGIYDDYSGDILYDGINIRKNPTITKSVGYLPQQFGLFHELTVYEMLSYFACIRNIPRKQQNDTIIYILKQVNLLEYKDKRIKTLSGGMIRRLGIAQAIMSNPQIIVVDEPTAGLDPEERVRFKNLISQMKDGKIILISTHIVEDIEAVCSHVLIIHEGKIISFGCSDDIRNYARNHVFILEAANEKALLGTYFIERRFDQDGVAMIRVLSNQDQPGVLSIPTIEDGYLFKIKGLG